MVERTKNADGENFPVASKLILPKLRPAVAAFYDFARTADDIADSPDLSTSEKLQMLNELEAVLRGSTQETTDTACAAVLAEKMKQHAVSDGTARDLLKAFRLDAENKTYETFDELMNYCRYSAASVGRFMLDLHHESPSAYWTADALCAALQLNNHLQDCKDDFQRLGRVYLPQSWMKEEGATVDMLNASTTDEALQRVFNRLISGIDGLLTDASPLPMTITGRGLRMEVGVIYRLAARLSKHLKTQDILSKKVELRPIDWAYAFAFGIFGGLKRKKITCPAQRPPHPPKPSF